MSKTKDKPPVIVKCYNCMKEFDEKEYGLTELGTVNWRYIRFGTGKENRSGEEITEFKPVCKECYEKHKK